MRKKTKQHVFSLIHFVMLASLNVCRIHAFSMENQALSERQVTMGNIQLNDSGFSQTISSPKIVSKKEYTPFSVLSSMSTSTSTSRSLMPISDIYSATIPSFQLELTRLSENNNISSLYVTPITSTKEASSTSTLSGPRQIKSSSKFPVDMKFTKNHWVNSDSVANAGFSQTTSDVEGQRIFRNKHHHEHHWGPFFEEPLDSTTAGVNLASTAHLFTEAVLNCRVGMLKDKTVMWVRRTTEKVSLLTVGNVTYTGDPRIRVKFQYPNNWRLIINPAHWDDAGVYMCQVSTHPPRVFTTNLTILEPPLRLIDEHDREISDRYYKSGSSIDLRCQISKSFMYKERANIIRSLQFLHQGKKKTNRLKAKVGMVSPGPNDLQSSNKTSKQGQVFDKQFNNYILWTKDDEFLSPSTVRRSSSTFDKWINSQISIPDASPSDSGNYSCSIGKLFAAVVQVQVLTGELPAAVQHNLTWTLHQNHQIYLILTALTVLYILSKNKLLATYANITAMKAD